MKKTIKTGVMIALFVVCIFLLLPFIITERTNEQKDEQLRTAQPQVYSSNPLTAFLQRAKDLLASNRHANKDASRIRNKAAKDKEIARGAQKLSAKGPESLAAQRMTSDDRHDASGSSFYTPKNYDFALYQSVGNGVASDGAIPAAQTAEHNPLFLADVPENTPTGNGVRNFTRSRNKALASTKKSVSGFPTGYSLGGIGATAGALGVNMGRNASNTSLPANTDTAKILQDIARMRANAKYPNPQTEAERLARDEFMKKETERYQRELDRLYWNSVFHPHNPQDPQDQPDIEDFEKDVLGKIIIDTTGSNTIKSLNFVEDPQGDQEYDSQQLAEAQQAILQKQLAKNNMHLEDLSKEDLAFLEQDLPIIVNLGTTTDTTWEEVAQEIHRLNAEGTENEQQAGDKEGQEAGAQQAETQAAPEEDPKAKEYQEFLEQFLWLYTEAGCDTQDCSWLAADPNMQRLKHLKKGAALANSHVMGDPLGLQKQFWEKYKDKVLAEKEAQNQQNTAYQNEEDAEIAAELQELEQVEAVTTAAGSFVEFANYIPHNDQKMEEVNKKFLNNTTGKPEAGDKPQKVLLFSANAYHTRNAAQKGIGYDSLLTPNPSLEELTTLELFAGAVDQAKIDHLKYRENAAGLIQDETQKASQEIIKQNLEQNKTAPSGKKK